MLLTALLLALSAPPHSGGTDANGCHTNRRTGQRHCHGGSAPEPAAQQGGEVYFPNCDAARRAGRAPLRRGQPGYRPGLDRDGDGVACE